MEINFFVATKAFIRYQNKILIIRESKKYQDGSNFGQYVITGGRIKPGENHLEGLRREVREETGLEINPGKPFFVNEWRPIVNGDNWQIIGIFFDCTADTDQVILDQDHDDYLWIDPLEYKNYNLVPDLYPVFEAYLEKN